MTRLLALDIGAKRIGVAVSDESQLLATPLTTITRASKREDFEMIAKLIAAHRAEKLIVGLPRTLRGEEGPQAARVRRYAEALTATIDIPVVFQDERYTTVEAEERLAGSPRRRRRPGDIDAAAAAIILQDYLDGRRTDDEGRMTKAE
ncbi:MAG TPA: Holliday junction resolvase RuvX [Anaerolineae bacterium]|nr:Holliday junction resolvase RuvX [Anaerolineae bacterium]